MALESMRRQGVEGVGMGMWLVVRVPRYGFEAAPRCLPCCWHASCAV